MTKLQGGFWFWGWRLSQIRIGSAWIGISNSKKGKAKCQFFRESFIKSLLLGITSPANRCEEVALLSREDLGPADGRISVYKTRLVSNLEGAFRDAESSLTLLSGQIFFQYGDSLESGKKLFSSVWSSASFFPR